MRQAPKPKQLIMDQNSDLGSQQQHIIHQQPSSRPHHQLGPYVNEQTQQPYVNEQTQKMLNTDNINTQKQSNKSQNIHPNPTPQYDKYKRQQVKPSLSSSSHTASLKQLEVNISQNESQSQQEQSCGSWPQQLKQYDFLTQGKDDDGFYKLLQHKVTKQMLLLTPSHDLFHMIPSDIFPQGMFDGWPIQYILSKPHKNKKQEKSNKDHKQYKNQQKTGMNKMKQMKPQASKGKIDCQNQSLEEQIRQLLSQFELIDQRVDSQNNLFKIIKNRKTNQVLCLTQDNPMFYAISSQKFPNLYSQNPKQIGREKQPTKHQKSSPQKKPVKNKKLQQEQDCLVADFQNFKPHNNNNKRPVIKGKDTTGGGQILQFKLQTVEKFIDKDMLKTQNQLQIGQTKVYFPHKPYDIQLEYMKKVIEALQKPANALLESPTGTGKTLCLLCSVLSWIYKNKEMGRHRKVIYLSRTHSQLYQVQNQLKNTCFRPNMSIVGSRDHFCVKDDYQNLKGRQKVQACTKAVKISARQKAKKGISSLAISENQKNQQKERKKMMCEYYQDKTQSLQLAMKVFSNKILDIQSFKIQGKERHFCPYYYAFHTQQLCDLFVMPYNYLLDIDLLPRYGNMLAGSVVIFDQAQNVAQAACQGRSYQIFNTHIEGAILQIEKLSNQRSSLTLQAVKKQNAEFIKDTTSFLNGLLKHNNQFINTIDFASAPNQKEKLYMSEQSKIVQVIDQKQTQLALIELFNGLSKGSLVDDPLWRRAQFKDKTISSVSTWSSNLLNLIQQIKQTQDGSFSNLQKVATFWSKAVQLIKKNIKQTCFRQNQLNHFRLLIKSNTSIQKISTDAYLQTKSRQFSLEMRCLVPWLTFQKILAYGPRSILFTSGTMSPLDQWQKQLAVKAPIKLVNSHVISQSQIRLNIIKKSISNQVFNFGYKNLMNRDRDDIYQDLLKSILQIIKRIPNGVIVVCPNFRILGDIRFYVNSTIFKKDYLKQKKLIFQERNNQGYIQNFKHFSQAGAILFCVCRGKASQGIDFPDHHCRAVIFVGVPFPNVKDPILVEKRGHYDRLKVERRNDGLVPQINWQSWYFNNTIRAVSQSIGRVIRHSKDYGMIFLLDQRYAQPRFQNSLPKWTKPQTINNLDNEYLSSIRQFYRTNQITFQGKARNYEFKEESNGREKQQNNGKGGLQKLKPRIQLLDTTKIDSGLMSWMKKK